MKLTSKLLALSAAGFHGLPLSTFALPPSVEATAQGGGWSENIFTRRNRQGPAVQRPTHMRRYLASTLLILAAAFHLISPPEAKGTPLVSANASCNLSAFTPAQTNTSGTVTDVERGAFNGGSGFARSEASHGVLRGYSEADVNPNSGGLIFGSNTVSFRDDLLIDAPGRTGTAGRVILRFTIEGTLNASAQVPEQPGSTYASVEYVLEQGVGGPGGGAVRRQSIDSNGNPTCCSENTILLNIPQTVALDFTFGTPFEVTLKITALAVATPNRPADFSGTRYSAQARTNLANTATWGGFDSVTDGGGNPVSNYTFSSTSGANYTQPIVPQCATPSNALAGWWPGDGNTRDIDSGNNGALESGATYALGKVGQAFTFSSPGARMRIPHSAALDFNATQDYSVDFWMKAAPQAAAATLVEKNGGTFPYSIQLLPSGNIFAAASDGTATVSATSTGALGNVANQDWNHIAVVFRHSTSALEIYINGQRNVMQSYTATLGPLANGQDVYFGARAGGGNSFNGQLDEVDIHAAALSFSEVQAILVAGRLGKCRPALVATSVVSRKTHGSAGDFDVNLPLSGTPAVECRSGGATRDYQIVVNFTGAIEVTGSPQAAVSAGSGDIGSGGVANGGAVAISGSSITVPLTNVSNAQNLRVTLFGVSNGATTADLIIPMGVLVGDTTGNGSVTGTDIGQVKAAAAQAVSGANFRLDVTANGGSINASDVGLVKSMSGMQLPPAAPDKQ